MAGLYIHVPFCEKRCAYCSFYSTTFGKKERDMYVEALKREMQERAKEVGDISTIYFGGGTPSQLDPEELADVFQSIRYNFNVASDAEITFECNPDDVTIGMLHQLKALGVNRVSMGVQTFDDVMLHTINRRHNAQQALDAIDACHKVGVKNISIDLIYGLPGQSMSNWKRELDHIAELITSDRIQHLSSYALSIEEGTHLYNMRAKGLITEVNEDDSLEMYEMLVDCLKTNGFEHYEISNFARPGYRSRHNSNYWVQTPYLGLGPGAHSYDGHITRRYNLPDLKRYISEETAPHNIEELTKSELYDELVMTRLRTSDGLPLCLLTDEERQYIKHAARRYVNSGDLMIDQNDTLKLTRKGIFISDMIYTDLMWDV